MGSVILGSVARTRESPSIDLNNNSDIVESAKEAHLLESPPLGAKHNRNSFKPELLTNKFAKIGKIAKISDRKASGEKKLFDNQVSHVLINSCDFFDICGTGRKTTIELRGKKRKSSRQLKKKTLTVIRGIIMVSLTNE